MKGGLLPTKNEIISTKQAYKTGYKTGKLRKENVKC
jgi:hypothetical protein